MVDPSLPWSKFTRPFGPPSTPKFDKNLAYSYAKWTAKGPRGSTMADESLFQKVHDLSDLELAILLSLIAREHCLISTPQDGLDDLVEELRLVWEAPFFFFFLF